MNLDQKLRDILRPFVPRTAVELHNDTIVEFAERSKKAHLEAIEQIKQAFQDAGYSKVKTIWHHPDVPVMTGPEWYERFKEELTRTKVRPNIVGHVAHTNIQDTVLEAAKRASGLTNRENTD